jgi:hypothetical protein
MYRRLTPQFSGRALTQQHEMRLICHGTLQPVVRRHGLDINDRPSAVPSGTISSKAPVETAQPSNQSSEPSISHDIHCPVRVEFVSEPSTINATPTPHSQNAGGRHNTSAIATAATKSNHIRTRELRNVNALSMTSNVRVEQRAAV